MAVKTTGEELREAAGSRERETTRDGRRRYITPQAGRALELLGHAIEYLTDEYVHGADQLSPTDPQVEAIQLLMALNREVYYECPVVPRLSERLRSFFGITSR